MHNYNNFYLNNFKTHVDGIKYKSAADGENVQQLNPASSSEIKELSNVTPDYNVSVPVGYTKTGVKTLSNGQEIHCYKLNNGQKVYIAPKESSNTVLNTYVNTGSMNEKDSERGISHFCEHMAFNGTYGTDGYMKLGIGDVFRKVDELGGNTNASTNFAETNYTISIPQFNKQDFETIVKMQSSMMNNLEMSDAMTDKEHGPVTSEINMYSDMPDNIILNAAIKNLYNIQTSSNDIVAGTVDNILNVDSKKVMDYYKNNYFPANMTTVVTGDVNPDEAIELIAKNFRGTNPTNPDRRLEPLKVIDKPVRKDIISQKAVATTGVLCFNGPANNDVKDNIAIEAVNYLLFNKKNSVSKKQLRDYNIEVHATRDKIRTEPTDGALLSLMYNATEDNSEVALKSVFNTLAYFQAPSDEDMEVLKTGLKMRYDHIYENTEDLNYLIGQNSLSGSIDACTEAIKQIDALTGEDLVNAVHKYYDLNKTSIAVIHPEQANSNTIAEKHNLARSISFTGAKGTGTNSAKAPLKTDKIDNYKLNNNVQVALINTNSDIATISGYITTPAPANTKPGVMEVLSELITRGTDEKIKVSDKNNVSSFAGATRNYAYYEAELPAKNLYVGMELMKDTLFNPVFSEEMFEKAKKQVKNDILTSQPNAYENLKNDLFPESPRGYSNKDIMDNIDNITLPEVMGLHKYITDRGGLSFVASVPMEKYPASKNIINDELSSIRTMQELKPDTFRDYVPTQKSKVVKDVANTAQADVVQAYKFPMMHSPKEIVACELMNKILSGGDETGLFNNLREKEKLAYSVHSSLNTSQFEASTLTCRILTTTDSPDLKSYDNVEKSIKGFTRQINKMKTGEFTDKELDVAKLNFKRQLLNATENSADKVLTASKGINSVNGLDEINQEYNEIDGITKEDIINAANKIFNNKPLYSVRASKDTIDANEEFFKTLEG